MPVIACPYPDCTYCTDDISEALASTMLTIHASGVHAPGAATTIHKANAKVETVRRPTISSAGTSEDWSYFLSRWSDYATATKIAGVERTIQLLECCDEELRKDLTRSAGGSLSHKTESEVLAAIQKLAVREENTMVARVTLNEMRQSRDEPIRSFGARIQGQASVCKYVMDCPSCQQQVNYMNNILQDVLIRGIADPDIQLDLLGSRNQDMSLEEIFKFVEAKEAGKRSASKILASVSVDAASSQYAKAKKGNQDAARRDKFNKDICTFCGKTGHGKNAPWHIRKNSCSAYGHSCTFCKQENHHESVCRKKKKDHKEPDHVESAFFEALCVVESIDNFNTDLCDAIALDHHLYDNMNSQWVQTASESQPYISVKMSVHQEDYADLKCSTKIPDCEVVQLAMADTGCQSCLASLKVVNRLGIKKSDLIPVKLTMRAANNNGINILGASIIRFSGCSSSGKQYQTRQIVYVTNDADKLFLSREACRKLGMISDLFPAIGVANSQSSTDHGAKETATTSVTSTRSACGCAKRQLPPTKPTSLPFPATEDNRVKLKDWLLQYYQSFTFNTCEHEPLALMAGPPLSLSHSCAIALAGCCQGKFDSGCKARGNRTRSSRRASDMVPSYGGLCKE